MTLATAMDAVRVLLTGPVTATGLNRIAKSRQDGDGLLIGVIEPREAVKVTTVTLPGFIPRGRYRRDQREEVVPGEFGRFFNWRLCLK